MVNPSDDAQFASLYGRLLPFPQAGAAPVTPTGLASLFPALTSATIDFCQQNPSKGQCSKVNSGIKFCQQNPDKDQCPSIKPIIASSEFCRQHPGGLCPPAPPTDGPPGANSPALPPLNTSSSLSPESPSSESPSSETIPVSSLSSPRTSSVPSESTSATLTPTATAIVTLTQSTTIASTSLSGSSEKSPGSSPFPSGDPADPTLAASPTTSPAQGASTKPHNKAIPIIAGVVVPVVLVILAAAGFILYKRRKRARDRREWERTHAEIADAVRQIGAPVKVAVGPAWSGDLKTAPDGDGDALSYSYEKSGGMESSTRLP